MKAPRAIVAMLLGTLAFAGLAQAAERAEKPGKIDLKILYAGHPNTPREKDFVGFLSKHFTHVATGDLAKFKPASGKGTTLSSSTMTAMASRRPESTCRAAMPDRP